MYGTDKLARDTANLAYRPPLSLGTTLIFPSTREIRGPGGVAIVQPRVMHVLLALADAQGAVVTRDALAERCWNGRFVADDSLNGAVAELRKALRSVAAEGASIETVPKTGYRLVSHHLPEMLSIIPAVADSRSEALQPRLTRRVAVVGGVAALATASVAGWMATRPDGAEAALLIERGSQALRQGLPDAGAQGIQFFKKAIQLEPDNAKGWGMLALAWRAAADYGGPENTANARDNAEIAAKRALKIDPRQSDALTALAILTPSFGQWFAAERRIRAVLAVDPDNEFAVAALATLLMSTGQVRACLERLDWLEERDLMSPNLQFRRVYTLWSMNRLAEMDRTSDRALQSWPRHPAVWFARFVTLGFTGRGAAALGMLGDTAARPPIPPPAARVLELSMKAVGGDGGAEVEAAVTANLAAAPRGPNQAITAIMVLSRLAASGAAMEVAQGFLLRRGPLVVQLRHTAAQPSITDQHHRMAMMLWVPATQALRLHPGFQSLCDGIGMVDYWKATRTRPDFDGGSLSLI